VLGKVYLGDALELVVSLVVRSEPARLFSRHFASPTGVLEIVI
jgi:hypothetical protein